LKKISIIIPVFNEEKTIPELYSRIVKSADALPYEFKFMFVEDGSTDGTLGLLLDYQKKDSRIAVIKLTRNWGYQNSLNAGLDYAEADAVIMMDGDLEDPPETIGHLLNKWNEGFDIVEAVKEARYVSPLKRAVFSIFYRLMERFSNVRVARQSGVFSLIDRRALSQLKLLKEKNKYYSGLRAFIGFRRTQILYRRQKRYAGRPKQTLRKLVNYALDAFFSFSFFPVRVLTYLGLMILLVIISLSILLVIIKIFAISLPFTCALPSWMPLVLLILFVSGVQILFMGILGEYIARIFDEVRNRPYYLVDSVYANTAENSKIQ